MDERVTDEDSPALPAWRAAPPTVGAVLVTHDGGRWLPQVLASFSALEHAPTSWRVVDVSSTDDGPELVREAFGPDRVTYAPAGTGFGAAVRLAVDAMPRTDWLWLLHDDAIVEPGALAALLDEATAADDVAVVGPKIREWPSLRRLLEVGLTVTSTGVRETGLETGEPDAGQHDWPKDVLAVDTAGMLMRRDVWDELDGLSPDLPLYFDDIDLGWRVARAGYRTRVAPRAVIFHAEASRRGTRRRAAGDVEPAEQRRAALHTMLANTSGPRFWWQYVRLLVGSLLRTLGLVLSAHPEAAGDQLQAVASVYGRPGRLRAARRRRAATARRDDRAVRHLFAPFWLPYRHGFDTARDVAAALVRPEAVETTGRRSTLDDDGDDVVTLDDGPPLWVRRPWLVTVGVLVVLSLVAGRSLLTGAGDSILTGGALGVTPGSAGDWWRLWFERSHEIGLGGTGLVSPAVLLLAVAATPIWPSPGLLVAALLLLSVPLAALTAHRLGRRLTDHRRLRIVWAVGYGLTVAASGAVAQGRLGTVVALVVLPVVVVTTLQVAGVDPLSQRASWRTAVRWGVWVAVGAAFAPVLLPLALLGALVVAALDPRLVRRLLLGLGVAVLLLGPWVVGRVLHPGLWWWESGSPLAGGDPGWRTALGLVVGRAGAPEQAPVWLGAGLVVLAVLALASRAARAVVVVCWTLALLALGVAVLGVVLPGGVPGTSVDVRAWVGVPAAAVALALGTAALVGVPPLVEGRGRAWVGSAVVLALLLPVGTAAWWIVRGVDDPLERGRPDTVPAFLTDRGADTVVVTGTTARGLEVAVVRGEGPIVGAEGLRPPASSRRALVDAVEGLVSAPGSRAVRSLSDLGVDAVYAPDVDTEVARALDAAPGLEPSGSESPTSRVWTLAEPTQPARPEAPAWRPLLAAGQALLWLVAVVLTAPVRRRPSAVDAAPSGDSTPGGGRRVRTDGVRS